jgi:hypothetical protein
VEELRQLDPDRTAAEDDQALGRPVGPDGVAARPVPDVLETLDRRKRRRRAGGDDEMLVLELAAVDCDDAGPRDARLASHELRALLGEPAFVPRVVAAARHLVAPPEHALGREVARDRLGGAGSDARRGEHLTRPQQRLRRNARVVGALAAREPVLDDRDVHVAVETPQRADEVLAGRAGPENDNGHGL